MSTARTYTIRHTGGAYLRATMTSATSDDVQEVLRAAMAYVAHCDTPIITRDDGDEWSAYEDAQAARDDKATLVAVLSEGDSQ